MTGEEDGPNDLTCFKCGKIPYLSGNPYGTHILDVHRADDPHRKSAIVLCDPCAIDMWEYLTPGIAKDPHYIAGKDQHTAGIPDMKRHWNERACEHEQIEGV